MITKKHKEARGNYPSLLKDMGLKLLEPFTSASEKHSLKCLTCKHEFEAAPKIKISAHKKTGTNGCPNCKILNEKRKALVKIEERGFKILTPLKNYTGQQMQIKVKNLGCGHIFESRAGNLANRNINCPVCRYD